MNTKVFYWVEPDPRPAPTGFPMSGCYLVSCDFEESFSYLIHWDEHEKVLRELMRDGYVEISQRTAVNMRLPM